jgi:hypothetical protein
MVLPLRSRDFLENKNQNLLTFARGGSGSAEICWISCQVAFTSAKSCFR